MAVLILFSGCIRQTSTRKESGETNKAEVEDLLNETLRAQGIGPLEGLVIDKRTIDINTREFITAQQIDKIEILEGSSGCDNFKITMEYKGEDLRAFKVETSRMDGCFVSRG